MWTVTVYNLNLERLSSKTTPSFNSAEAYAKAIRAEHRKDVGAVKTTFKALKG